MAAIVASVSICVGQKMFGIAHVGSKFFLSSGDLKLIKVGNSKIMFLPSSMIGVRQYAQLTLHGSLWTVVFSELSYQPKS